MRVSEKAMNEYPWYVRLLLSRQEKKYGQVLKGALLWARQPKLFAAVAVFYGVLERRKSPIDPVLRSLVMVRVSQINGCAACVDINGAALARRCGSMEKVEALDGWRKSRLFDDREKAVLEYAEAVTFSDQQVSDELVECLSGFFDQDGIIELTGLIAFQNLSSKFNSALDVPAQGFCRLSSNAP